MSICSRQILTLCRYSSLTKGHGLRSLRRTRGCRFGDGERDTGRKEEEESTTKARLDTLVSETDIVEASHITAIGRT